MNHKLLFFKLGKIKRLNWWVVKKNKIFRTINGIKWWINKKTDRRTYLKIWGIIKNIKRKVILMIKS
jgi:hypothetical protein